MTGFIAADNRGHIVTVQCRGADTFAVGIGLFPEDPVALIGREDARALRDYLTTTLAQADAHHAHPHTEVAATRADADSADSEELEAAAAIWDRLTGETS